MTHRLFGSVFEYLVLSNPSETELVVEGLVVLVALFLVEDAALFPVCHQISPAMIRAMMITINTTFLRTILV